MEVTKTASDTIKELAKSDTTNLLADDGTADHNTRYVGANPNNYVTFNNEQWRIVGVMNNIDDGTGKKESRVKLVRNNQIISAPLRKKREELQIITQILN